MVIYQPAPNYTMVEPPSPIGLPRRFALSFQQTGMAAADNAIDVYLDKYPPWNLFPQWVEIRSLKVGLYHSNLAGTVLVSPDLTVGRGAAGFVPWDPVTLTGLATSDDAYAWDTPIITRTDVKDRPFLHVLFETNAATDQGDVYIDGFFYEPFDQRRLQGVDVRRLLGYARG